MKNFQPNLPRSRNTWLKSFHVIASEFFTELMRIPTVGLGKKTLPAQPGWLVIYIIRALELGQFTQVVTFLTIHAVVLNLAGCCKECQK